MNAQFEKVFTLTGETSKAAPLANQDFLANTSSAFCAKNYRIKDLLKSKVQGWSNYDITRLCKTPNFKLEGIVWMSETELVLQNKENIP